MRLVVHQLIIFSFLFAHLISLPSNATNLVMAPINDPALKDLLIRTMFVDKKKRIYLGTDSGLYRYTNQNLVKLDNNFAITAKAFNGAISNIQELDNRYLVISAFLSDVIYFDRINDGYVKAPYGINKNYTYLTTEKITNSHWLWNTKYELLSYSSSNQEYKTLLSTLKDERINSFKFNKTNNSLYVMTVKGLYFTKDIDLPLKLIFATSNENFPGSAIVNAPPLMNSLFHYISDKKHLIFENDKLISQFDIRFCQDEYFKKIDLKKFEFLYKTPYFYNILANKLLAISECGVYQYDLINRQLQTLIDPKEIDITQWLKGTAYSKELPVLLETYIGLFLIDKYADVSLLRDKTSASLGGATFSVEKVNNDQYIIADGTPGLKIASSRINQFNNLKQADLERITGGHSLRDIIKIDDNTLWLSSQTNGLFKVLKHQGLWRKSQQYLANTHVRSLYKDNNLLWIATEGAGLYQINLTNDSITEISSPKEIFGFLKFLPLNDELLLIGTTNGVLLYNKIKAKLIHKIENISGPVWAMAKDSKSNIWIGTHATNQGLFKLDTNFDILETYLYKDDLYNSAIMDMVLDEHEQPVLATWGGGLLYRKFNDTKFSQLNAKDGLLNDTIQSIIKLSGNQYWLSTEKGLAQVTLCQRTDCINKVKTYTMNDGLATNLFDLNSAHLNPDGTLIYGGFFGLSWFDPKKDIIANNVAPAEHYVNSLSVDGKVMTNKLIMNNNKQQQLQLHYDIQHINISFNSDDYIDQSNKQYRYKINSSNWTITQTPEIHLSALTHGNYLITAGSSNSDGLWSQNNLKLLLIISPPIWLSFYAKLAYLVIFIITIFSLFKFRNAQLSKQNHILEQKVKEKTILLSNAIEEKEHMFESSSHELQTPLTLILNYLDLISKEKLTAKGAEYTSIIKCQSQRLRYLVRNMLLNADTPLPAEQCVLTNVTSTLTTLIEHHTLQADKANITLNFHSEVKGDVFVNLVVDSDQIIFGNLIGNAIKYSPNGSIVTIALYLKYNNLVFCISDQGPGFNDLNKICQKYYRESKHIQGTGLGLWNVKEYVKKNQGTLNITNNAKLGCKITLALPLSCQQTKVGTIKQATPTQLNYQVKSTSPSNTGKKLYNVLLVEDDANLTILFKETLATQYRITFCCNGNQALEYLQQAKDELPEVIVSDVMMPIMSGFELCERVKQSDEFKHIPFLLLTAKSDNSSLYKGLSLGADDYINKPFKMSNLQLKINNIIKTKEAQKLLQLNYVTAKDNTEVIENNQDQFIFKIKESLEANQQNSSYSISNLADTHNMSTSTLRRKLKQYFDLTFTEILKKSRMNKAKKLLKTGKQIQIIAEECGYSNTSYFNKHFKEEFKLSPKEFRK